jgi:hypothetical protein
MDEVFGLGSAADHQDDELDFELDFEEEQLLEEFGVLMAAEYNYGVTRFEGQWVRPPERVALTQPDQILDVAPSVGRSTSQSQSREGPAPKAR